MAIKITTLGAGQDVGKSCILVTLGNKTVMLDCGMHMGYPDHRQFPDFGYISKNKDFTNLIDCVVITHFHLDHCGALPYFTEVLGYQGPIIMTHPTKAICPILLEDYRKILLDRRNNNSSGKDLTFTEQNIKDCMERVTPICLNESIFIKDSKNIKKSIIDLTDDTYNSEDMLEIKAFYAGHVLGASIFLIKYKQESIIYTGDYNMTPDRHLNSANIEYQHCDLLITESTYANTIRTSKKTREQDFLKKVLECVINGGKVIIPVYAIGRAQELMILLDDYWNQNNIKIPIYFSTGLTQKATNYYKLFVNTWTTESTNSTKSSNKNENIFDFKNILPWDNKYLDEQRPMVLFSTPGVLHVGTSFEVFKKWAPDPKNMVIMPGYCTEGTLGAKVLAGQKTIVLDKYKNKLDCNLKVENLSFSAHADSKGILRFIKQVSPKSVMLVHGDKTKMSILKRKIARDFDIPCFDPENGQTFEINFPDNEVVVQISKNIITNIEQTDNSKLENGTAYNTIDFKRYRNIRFQQETNGFLVLDQDKHKIPVLYQLSKSKGSLNNIGLSPNNNVDSNIDGISALLNNTYSMNFELVKSFNIFRLAYIINDKQGEKNWFRFNDSQITENNEDTEWVENIKRKALKWFVEQLETEFYIIKQNEYEYLEEKGLFKYKTILIEIMPNRIVEGKLEDLNLNLIIKWNLSDELLMNRLLTILEDFF